MWMCSVNYFLSHTEGKLYDASAADQALAYRLHYYTGGNCERVRELMMMSGLRRDKWDREDYLPRTILSARGNNFYALPTSRQEQNNKIGAQNQQNLTIPRLRYENYPEISSRGKVLDTAANLKVLLYAYDVTVRWNNMSRMREITIPEHSFFQDDAENYALCLIKDLALINEMPIIRIDEHLDFIAQQDNFHPIVEQLKQNPWDGIPRLNSFIATLTTTNDSLTYKLLKRWMISAIAAIHTDKGFSASGVLVLAGEQYLGKTQFIKSLDPYDCDAIKGGATLDPMNKDCVRTLSEFWIAELGELDASFRKADIARLKSYLTESSDKIRLPYARKDSVLKRRTVFAATVNDPQFLIDDTGNRRWWTISRTRY